MSRDPLLKNEELDFTDTSASLDLLLQFQRLLVARLFPGGHTAHSHSEIGVY